MDTWVDSGTTVTPHYDSLLAKLMVLGSDREDATRKLRAALDRVVLSGIPSNLECACCVRCRHQQEACMTADGLHCRQ